MNHKIESIVKKVTNSKSPILAPLNYIIYRYVNNNLYPINDVIKKAKIIDGSKILIEVKNGDKLTFTTNHSIPPTNLINKIKFSDKSKINHILDYEKYFFIYDIIDEVYVHGSHFNQIDYTQYNTIIDAGANIGAFTINSRKSIKAGTKYYLFEPELNNAKDLEYNLDLNDVHNYTVIKKGLWNSDTTLTFYKSNRAGEHSLINYGNSDNTVNIEVTSLESFFNSHEIQFPVLIKMDIEGAELEVISSSIEFLSKQKGLSLLIEALHSVDGRETYKDLVPLLKKNNFEIVNWDNDFRGTIYAINTL